MFVVVSYDIGDDRRRDKVARVLQGFGERVQESVFECHLSTRQYEKLRSRLATVLVLPQDSIRYYLLCRKCVSRIAAFGKPVAAKTPPCYLA